MKESKCKLCKAVWLTDGSKSYKDCTCTTGDIELAKQNKNIIKLLKEINESINKLKE